MSERTPQEGPVSSMTIIKVVLAIEGISLVIALATTIVPSKTGGRSGFAHLFMDDPSFLIQVVVNFAAVNILLTMLAAVFFIMVWRGNKSDAKRGG